MEGEGELALVIGSCEMDSITTAAKPQTKALLVLTGLVSSQRIEVDTVFTTVRFAQGADGPVKGEVEIRFKMVYSPLGAGEDIRVAVVLEPLLD